MKTSGKSSLIKFVFAYIDLIYKIFPLIILVVFSILFIISLDSVGKDIGMYDVLNVFTFKKIVGMENHLKLLPIIAVILNLLIFVLIYLALRQVRGFIKNVYEESAFSAKNGERLKWVGIILAVIAVIKQLAPVILVSFFLPVPTVTTRILIFAMGLLSVVFNVYMIAGLFVVVIGQIMIQGAEIKEENDLTV